MTNLVKLLNYSVMSKDTEETLDKLLRDHFHSAVPTDLNGYFQRQCFK